MELIIGSHVKFNKDSGLVGSVKEAISYGANTFMFYTGPAQSTNRYPINSENSYEAYKLMCENNINPNNVIVHSPYIVNLANRSDERKYNFYIEFLINELDRVKELGFNKLVIHPGSAVNCSKYEGMCAIADALNVIFSKTNDTNILLEFMAGKGNEVGSSIDELKTIIDKVNDKNRIYVCLDTCHMNDAGVDLKKYDEFLDEFDSKIGINKIKCVHINDSMNSISSHKDRHDNIGYGSIGFDTMLDVIYKGRLEAIPYILETPYVNRNTKSEYAPYKYEIESIRSKIFNNFR